MGTTPTRGRRRISLRVASYREKKTSRRHTAAANLKDVIDMKIKTRLTKAILLTAALAGVCATGCVQEDLSGCEPVNNVALEFYFTGEPTRAVPSFTGMVAAREVSSVDVFVLDSAGNFLQHLYLDQAALDARPGADLHLEPGTYRVTAIANSGANTQPRDFETNLPGIGAGNVRYKNISSTNDVGDSDKLYRAPEPASARQTFSGTDPVVDGLITLRVPAGADYSQRVDFYPFHQEVEVRVIGYSGATPPRVEIAGVPAGVELLPGTHLLGSDGEPHAVQASKATTGNGNGGSTTTLVTFPFDLTSPDIYIRILDPNTGDLIYQAPMSLVVDPASIPTDLFERAKITIEFSFIDAEVSIRLVGWESLPVIPI